VSGEPRIGSSIVFAVDNPHGTQAAGATTYLKSARAPDSNYPCGRWLDNYGMAFAGAQGEILVRTSPPPITRVGTPFGGAGNPGTVTFSIPNNIGLIGVSLYSQGLIVDYSAALGVRFGVTDALEYQLRQ